MVAKECGYKGKEGRQNGRLAQHFGRELLDKDPQQLIEIKAARVDLIRPRTIKVDLGDADCRELFEWPILAVTDTSIICLQVSALGPER